MQGENSPRKERETQLTHMVNWSNTEDMTIVNPTSTIS